ncbi:hypothetical protein ACFL0T_00565 [Candidatus Omnitrophota bacterium]
MTKFLNIILIICVISFLLGLSPIYVLAQDFIYKSKGARDPFVPLASKDGKLVVTHGAISTVNDIFLEGIIYDPKGDSVAIVNDLIVKENDTIGTITIKKIESESVIFLYKDEEYVFKLKGEDK